jgi:hypothetical protein
MNLNKSNRSVKCVLLLRVVDACMHHRDVKCIAVRFAICDMAWQHATAADTTMVRGERHDGTNDSQLPLVTSPVTSNVVLLYGTQYGGGRKPLPVPVLSSNR